MQLPATGTLQSPCLGRMTKAGRAKISILEEDAASAGEIGYMARAMIWASMPHSKVDGAHYKRDNGIASITMLVDPEIGLPYGKLPRLITAWMTREAKLTGSRELMLGRSLNEFAGKLGLSTSGGRRGDTSRLKVQATKLFSTFVSLKAHQGNDFNYKNVAVSDDGMLLWNPTRPGERSLWESTVTLSEQFYAECVNHAVPFDLRVLHVLRSPLAIDLYMWLTWRVYKMPRPTLVPWKSLRFQFGAGYMETSQGMAHFRAEFHRCLRDVSVLYPAARFTSEQDGLRLYPSRTHVSVRSKLNVHNLGARS